MLRSPVHDVKVALLQWRNRLIADPRFRDWAARFWLTRPVARARASETFALVAGFVYSQILAAVCQSGLLELLARGPVDAIAAATACDLSEAAATRLLRAAASVQLAQAIGDGTYLLGRIGAAIHADPGVRAMITHHQLLYTDLADPLALLRRHGGGGALAKFWPYAQARTGDVGRYSTLMAASQPMVAAQALAAYPFARHRHMVDVGGGEGTFAAAVKIAAPKLDCTVFDLPEVVARVGNHQLARIGGSFLTDPLPAGHDLMTLVRILHDHDDPAVLTILRAAHAALAPGARLLIVEPMAGLKSDPAMGDGYFNMYLLAMGSGRARTPNDYAKLLKTAGFARSKLLRAPQPMIAQVIAATR